MNTADGDSYVIIAILIYAALLVQLHEYHHIYTEGLNLFIYLYTEAVHELIYIQDFLFLLLNVMNVHHSGGFLFLFL